MGHLDRNVSVSVKAGASTLLPETSFSSTYAAPSHATVFLENLETSELNVTVTGADAADITFSLTSFATKAPALVLCSSFLIHRVIFSGF